MTERIAVISDVHGNSFALEKVLADMERRGIETIVNLGDTLYGPRDVAGTFDLLAKHHVISCSGNEDRLILQHMDDEISATMEHVKGQLSQDMIQWLRELPHQINWGGRVYGCHGTPGSDTTYLLEELNRGHVGVRSVDLLDDVLASIEADVVLCGHSHVNRVVETKSKLIVNPGSVGLPAYDDDLPVYHVMACHGPHARYAVLDFSNGPMPMVEQLAVVYDWEAAAMLAERNGRPDWAKWLRTGSAG